MVSAGPAKQKKAASDNQVSAGGHFEAISLGGDGGHGGFGGGKASYGAGSGLKTIAQGSAEQASNAVASQHTAARQAAFAAKSSLAQAAASVSKTFESLLQPNIIILCYYRLLQQLK